MPWFAVKLIRKTMFCERLIMIVLFSSVSLQEYSETVRCCQRWSLACGGSKHSEVKFGGGGKERGGGPLRSGGFRLDCSRVFMESSRPPSPAEGP